jgi:hypothetical protein
MQLAKSHSVFVCNQLMLPTCLHCAVDIPSVKTKARATLEKLVVLFAAH